MDACRSVRKEGRKEGRRKEVRSGWLEPLKEEGRKELLVGTPEGRKDGGSAGAHCSV
jgi:hypothetical protein